MLANHSRDAQGGQRSYCRAAWGISNHRRNPMLHQLPQFPDEMEAIQLPRSSFEQFAGEAKSEGIQFLGGCCGCNAAYIHAFARGLAAERIADASN